MLDDRPAIVPDDIIMYAIQDLIKVICSRHYRFWTRRSITNLRSLESMQFPTTALSMVGEGFARIREVPRRARVGVERTDPSFAVRDHFTPTRKGCSAVPTALAPA